MPGLSDFSDSDISYSVNLECGMPTLEEILSSYSNLFYEQHWYEGEDFLQRRAEPLMMPTFEQWSFPCTFPKQDIQRVSASSLSWLYVHNPDAPIWNKYLWADDLDRNGDRIYIGGKSNTGKLEIHRHLTITSRWGLPVF